jgi:hypothetical protein
MSQGNPSFGFNSKIPNKMAFAQPFVILHQ